MKLLKSQSIDMTEQPERLRKKYPSIALTTTVMEDHCFYCFSYIGEGTKLLALEVTPHMEKEYREFCPSHYRLNTLNVMISGRKNTRPQIRRSTSSFLKHTIPNSTEYSQRCFLTCNFPQPCSPMNEGHPDIAQQNNYMISDLVLA